MFDDLKTQIYKGTTEEHVKYLLGEPDFLEGENSQRYEYFANPGFMDPIMFYIEFEDGLVVEFGKCHL